MNYSKAVKGSKTQSISMATIQSQAKRELRRELCQTDINLLSTKYSSDLLSKQINKVSKI